MTSTPREENEKSGTGTRLGAAGRSLVALCLSSVLCGTTGAVLGATQTTAQASAAASDSPSDASLSAQLPLASSTSDTSLPLTSANNSATAESATPVPTQQSVARPRRPLLRSDIEFGSTLATAKISSGTVEVYSEPGGLEVEWGLSVPTEFGGPRHFLVIGETEGWLQIQVPVRPNGSVGWIERSAVTLAPVVHRVQVDLSDRTVTVWENDEVVLQTTVAVGRDSAPTPEGSFYIRDIIDWTPESVYGPRVLALSSFSEVIDQINGGDAVVAIHGTNAPWDLGKAVSLGCIRLENEMVLALADLVGPGTPIEVVA